MKQLLPLLLIVVALGLWVLFAPPPERHAPVTYRVGLDLARCGYINPVRVTVTNNTATYIHRISWKVRTETDEAPDSHLTQRLLENETQTSCIKAPPSFFIASPSALEIDEQWYR